MNFGKIGAADMMWDINNLLPKGARWVEYLESTGTQWINTGVKPKAGLTSVELLFNVTSLASSARGVFGSRNTSAPVYMNTFNVFTGTIEGTNRFRVDWSYGATNAPVISSSYVLSDTITTGVDILAQLRANGSAQMLGAFGIPTKAKSDCYYSMVIGSINTGGTVFANGVLARWKHVKIYEDGVLIRDFRPIAIGTTGYMLDLVSGEYLQYGNKGTGDFVLGPDVTAPQIVGGGVIELSIF